MVRTHNFAACPRPADRDKVFFATHPLRSFRARRFVDGEGPLPPRVPLFADDGTGALGEVNLVIVKRIDGGRLRSLFAVSRWPSLKSDRAIIKFLRSRNIDPATLKRIADR